MGRIRTLEQIILQTKTLITALESADMDVVDYALSERDRLIAKMQSLDPASDDQVKRLNELQAEFEEYHNKSLKILEGLQGDVQTEIDEIGRQQSETRKHSEVNKKYEMMGQIAGSQLDLKK